MAFCVAVCVRQPCFVCEYLSLSLGDVGQCIHKILHLEKVIFNSLTKTFAVLKDNQVQ